MKSIDMCSHFHWGTGNGCNNPGGFWCFALICYQVRHCDTYVVISRFIPSHQKFLFKSLYIFASLGWTVIYDLCTSSNLSFLIWSSSGTQSIPRHLHAPFKSILHTSSSLVAIRENQIWNSLSFFYATKIRLIIVDCTIRHQKCRLSSKFKGCKSNSAIVSNTYISLMIRKAIIVWGLRLKASATTFTLPGWYYKEKS